MRTQATPNPRPRGVGAVTAALILAAAIAFPAHAAYEPPNILIILADDNPWSGYGFMQNLQEQGAEGCMFRREPSATCVPKSRPDLFPDPAQTTPTVPPGPAAGELLQDIVTPQLDALAGRGTVFPVAHAGSSVCMPSFQSTVTGRYERTHHRFDRPDGTAADVYYIPEFMNDALARKGLDACTDDEDCGQHGPCTNNTCAPVRYRSFGMSKIWTNPAKDPEGFWGHGWDCGLRQRGQARFTIDPILQFIRGEKDGGPYTQADHGTRGDHGFDGLCDWPKLGCKPTCDEPECRAVSCTEPGVPWDRVTDPWVVLYSPNLPHTPKDGFSLVKKRRLHHDLVTDPLGDPKGKCNFTKKATKCIFIPETDGQDWIPYDWSSGTPQPNADIDRLFHRMDRIKNDKTAKDGSYLTALMFLDYWTGELLQFLEAEPDARFGGAECRENPPPAHCRMLAETTVVIYQSDNGFNLPGSKASKRENGFRTPIVLYAPPEYDPQYEPGTPYSPVPFSRALASALDIVPTTVDYATDDAVYYETCAGDAKPDEDASPLPVSRCGTGCTDACSAGPVTPGSTNCGCLPGKSFRDPATFTRDQLYGERRNTARILKGAYLRLRLDPNTLPSPLNTCVPDGHPTAPRCHIRVERVYPTDQDCDLRIFDILEDPDQADDLMKSGGAPQAALDCWNARLNQLVRDVDPDERCGSATSSCTTTCGGPYLPCP